MSDFDQNKVDLLLQYILAVAGQESGWDRELGMIHLIKYVYLADLTFAKYHEGQSYTGLTWKFHHFGPWSAECYKRIEPALESVGATKKKIESDKHNDFIRWCADDYDLFDKLNGQMDLTIAGTIQKYVRKFGNDTYELLDFVYKTGPILNAAPEDVLDLMAGATPEKIVNNEKPTINVTVRQKKNRSKRLLAFKKQLNLKLDEKVKSRQAGECPLPPRYDDVFFEGLSQLDNEVGISLAEGKYLANFTESVWKSKARHDPEIS